MWALGNIGHRSTDMSSLGPEGSPGQATVSPSLTQGGSCQPPKGAPKLSQSPAEAVATVGAPPSLWPLHPPSRAPLSTPPCPSLVPLSRGPGTSSLPPAPSVQRLFILLTPYLLISLSPSFFLFLSSIDPPAPSLSFVRVALYRQISPTCTETRSPQQIIISAPGTRRRRKIDNLPPAFIITPPYSEHCSHEALSLIWIKPHQHLDQAGGPVTRACFTQE